MFVSINTENRLVTGISHDLARQNDLKLDLRESKLALQVIEF